MNGMNHSINEASSRPSPPRAPDRTVYTRNEAYCDDRHVHLIQGFICCAEMVSTMTENVEL